MILKSILLFSSALLIFSSSYAQLHVTTNGKKFVLLEEATGTWCGYCPDGAQNIQETIEPSFPQCIVASFHGPQGYGEPMMIAGDPFCTGAHYSGSFPYGCVDRNMFSGVVGKSRRWDNYIATDTGLTPKFDVSMKSTYDTGTRTLTVIVTGKVLVAGTGVWNVNAYVMEDSIAGSGANAQHSYCGAPLTGNHYETSCTGSTPWYLPYANPLPASMYSHMNVVRAVLATATKPIWGDLLFTNPTLGATASKTYVYTIPTTYVAKFMTVVGMIQKYGTDSLDRPIENAVKAKVKLMPLNALGTIAVSKTMLDVQLYPNPAKDYVIVKGMLDNPSDTRITVYNATGQVVFEKNYASGGSMFGELISVSEFSNGIYFMNITNNGEVVSRRFSVVK